MASFMGALESGITARRILEARDRRAVEKQRELLVVARRELPRYMEFVNTAVEKAATEGKLMVDINMHADELGNRVFAALFVWELFEAGYGMVERRRVPDGTGLLSAKELVTDAVLVGVTISWARVWDELAPVMPVGGGGRVLDLPRVGEPGEGPVVGPGMGEPPGMTQDDYPNGRGEPLPQDSRPEGDSDRSGDPMG